MKTKIISLIMTLLIISVNIPYAQAYQTESCKWEDPRHITFGNLNLSPYILNLTLISIKNWNFITPQVHLIETEWNVAQILFMKASLPDNVLGQAYYYPTAPYCTHFTIQIDEQKLTGLDYRQIIQIITHEIGHALGLAHSNVERSIMTIEVNPYSKYNIFIPTYDDYMGLSHLYGMPTLIIPMSWNNSDI